MSAAPQRHRVVIIGAGLAGVGLGVRLRQAGIEDFVIVERNESVGGTWFEHTYPGCACDIPTHLYSYSFARNPNWSRLFPRQQEILEYVRRTADEYGVTSHIRFGCEMERAEWNEDAGTWRVRTSTAGELVCDVLVSAIGATAEPYDPSIPGVAELRRDDLPLGALEPRPQPDRRARGGDRDRPRGGPVRPPDRRPREAAAGLPAHTAVGRAAP